MRMWMWLWLVSWILLTAETPALGGREEGECLAPADDVIHVLVRICGSRHTTMVLSEIHSKPREEKKGTWTDRYVY